MTEETVPPVGSRESIGAGQKLVLGGARDGLPARQVEAGHPPIPTGLRSRRSIAQFSTGVDTRVSFRPPQVSGCSIGRYGLPTMNLVTIFRHRIIGRVRWLLATGGEQRATRRDPRPAPPDPGAATPDRPSPLHPYRTHHPCGPLDGVHTITVATDHVDRAAQDRDRLAPSPRRPPLDPPTHNRAWQTPPILAEHEPERPDPTKSPPRPIRSRVTYAPAMDFRQLHTTLAA